MDSGAKGVLGQAVACSEVECLPALRHPRVGAWQRLPQEPATEPLFRDVAVAPLRVASTEDQAGLGFARAQAPWTDSSPHSSDRTCTTSGPSLLARVRRTPRRTKVR